MSIRDQIKRLEAQGHTGRTNAELHALNCAQTDAMSDSQLAATVRSREAAGKSAEKARAALRDRGYG